MTVLGADFGLVLWYYKILILCLPILWIFHTVIVVLSVVAGRCSFLFPAVVLFVLIIYILYELCPGCL